MSGTPIGRGRCIRARSRGDARLPPQRLRVRGDAPARRRRRAERCGDRQHLRRHRRGGAPGHADHPQAAARESIRPDHRHRLRRADRARALRRHARDRPRHRQRREDAPRDLPRLGRGLGLADSLRVQVNDIMSVRETAHAMVDGFGTNARAFVQVQNGCDHRCTFCIIPYGRGPSRSVPAGEVVAQVRRLVEAGYAEVVLTGVDITSYGADLPAAMTLGKLVRHILRHVPELARLRLSSIDQVEADAHLLAAIADEPRLMPHLHLSHAVGRRHDPQAHEAPALPRRCRAVLRRGAAAAAGHRVRRRLDRRLPHRDRADVRQFAGPGRRLRADLPARVPVLAAQGHAGGAHAAGCGSGGQGAGRAAAAAGRGGARRTPCATSWARTSSYWSSASGSDARRALPSSSSTATPHPARWSRPASLGPREGDCAGNC